jgi:membrane protein required for colicin V production
LLIDKLMTAVSLGFVNRLLGILFSLFKTILIMSVVFVILNALDSRAHFLPQKQIEESKFYRPISAIAPAIFPIIGEGVFEKGFRKREKEPEGVTI